MHRAEQSKGKGKGNLCNLAVRFLASPCPISLVWVPYLFCIGGFLTDYLVCYPGACDCDTMLCYTQSLIGTYTDWHPPIFAATWRLLRTLQNTLTSTEGTGQELFYLLQSFLLWGGLFLILQAGKRFWSVRFAIPLWMGLIVCTLTFAVWRDTVIISEPIRKDYYMLGAWLFAVGCLMNMPVGIVKRCLVGIIIFVLLFYGTALRHNAVLAVLPLIFWLVWHFLPTRFKNTPVIILSGSVLWILMLGTVHHINYNVLNTYRMYPLQERFFGDIFILNCFAPRHYKNPPNTFGNSFDDLTSAIFQQHYDKIHLHQRHAFKRIELVLHRNFEFAKGLVQITPEEEYMNADDLTVHIDNKILKRAFPGPLTKINEREVRESYPKDYILLRDAWIERIKQDPLVYARQKIKIWFRFMIIGSPRTFLFVSCGLSNGLTMLVIITLILLFTFSPRRLEPSLFPSLMLAWSAMFLALPLIIFLPDYDIRYLCWFYAASFVSIALFCSQSKLFHTAIETVQKRLEAVS